MSAKTKIQWCDSSVNPTTGCDGCELWNETSHSCYSGKLTARFGKSNPGLADDFDVVSTEPGRMMQAANWRALKGKRRRTKPWLDGLPRLIFVGDMADNFSSEVPFEFLRDEVVSAVTSAKGNRHQWLWVTKRPQRMAEFSTWLQKRDIPWPDNLWAGTSLTTQASTSRIAPLLNVGDHRTLRFLSVEPQWEQIDIKHWLHRLDWVIQGGMSGSHDHPFDLDWADDLRLQCYRAGRPYFLKQLGSCVIRDGQRVQVRRGHNGDWNLWPSDELKVRQMPLLAGVVGNRSLRQRSVR